MSGGGGGILEVCVHRYIVCASWWTSLQRSERSLSCALGAFLRMSYSGTTMSAMPRREIRILNLSHAAWWLNTDV